MRALSCYGAGSTPLPSSSCAACLSQLARYADARSRFIIRPCHRRIRRLLHVERCAAVHAQGADLKAGIFKAAIAVDARVFAGPPAPVHDDSAQLLTISAAPSAPK